MRSSSGSKLWALPVDMEVDGEETDPFNALIEVGWSLMGGRMAERHLCKVAMNRHGWPILVPCHADGRNRTAVTFGGIKRKRFNFGWVRATKAA